MNNDFAMVLNNGLFSNEEESHFTWRGCDVCADGLGASVYAVRGYRSLTEAQADHAGNVIEFNCCGDCLVKACS